jgi:hypothetical protein
MFPFASVVVVNYGSATSDSVFPVWEIASLSVTPSIETLVSVSTTNTPTSIPTVLEDYGS